MKQEVTKVEFPELFYHDPSELGEDAFKPFKFPTRETLAKLACYAAFRKVDDQMSRVTTFAGKDADDRWEATVEGARKCWLAVADAMIAQFYCVCGVSETNPCPDCPTPSEQ